MGGRFFTFFSVLPESYLKLLFLHSINTIIFCIRVVFTYTVINPFLQRIKNQYVIIIMLQTFIQRILRRSQKMCKIISFYKIPMYL